MKNILRNSNFGFTKWCVALIATFVTLSGVAQAQVKISQVYGAGGNTSAVYNTDYVELYNAGGTAQDLSGWSIQYAAKTGISWSVVAVSGTIQPGKYFLISLASGGTVGSALPAPDYTAGTGSVNLSATDGKVALANSITAFSGTVPTGAVDFVGFGTATTYEGTGAAPATSTANAIFRAGGGATDTNDNKANFSAAAAAPRNSSSGGGGSTPTITFNPTSLTGLTTTAGTASPAQTFTVTGANLSADLTVTAPTGFEVATDGATFASSKTLTRSAGAVSGTISVRIAAATAQGSPSGNVTLASTGATTANVAVSGTVTAAGTPSVIVSPTSATGLTNYVGQVSASTNYTVTGANLGGTNLVVTASTNAIEVSTNSSTGYTNSFSLAPSVDGTLSNVVYVRISALAPIGAVSATVGNVSGTASNNFTVSGTVTTPALTLVLNPTSVAENAGASASTGTVGIPTVLSSNLVVSLFSSNTAAATVPSTVTITNGQTIATFPIDAVANTNSYANATAVITASNASYASASATLTVQNVDVRVPTVVINKLYNSGGGSGADDVVELLVVGTGQPGSTVNLQGMILKDYSSSAANDTGGAYIFSSNLLWGSVKAGTLIVLTKPGTTPLAEDLDGSDFLIKINLSNTAYFTPGTGIFDIGGTELVQIKEANSGQAGSTGAIHSFAVGTSTAAQVSAAPIPKLVCTTSGNYPFAQNSTQTLADFNGTGAAMGTSALTMGIGNNATNSAYIASLRGSSDISISISSDATIVREDAGLQAGKITVSLSSAANTDLVVNLTASPSGIATIPASVTIPAGSNSALFDFTPINDNTIAGNRTVTFAGAANGWNSGSNTVTVVDVQFANPSVVINEVVNNGSAADSVELLVIQNNLSMVGMILKDFSTNMSGDAGAQYTFSDTALWQSVKAGTLVVLTMGATATEDTDASDGLVTVKLTNTTYFTLSGGGFDISNTDMVMIKSPGSGASGVTGAIHTFGNGPAGSLFKLANGAKLLFAAGGAGGGADNATSAISDYNGTGATAGNTLGTYNNTSNQTYITALRGSANSAPTDITLSSASFPENNPPNLVVGTLTTTDDNATGVSYDFAIGTGDTDNGAFNISGNSLRATNSLDFETKSIYSVLIRVTDAGGLTFTKQFTITLTNVNEAPSVTSAGVASVPENQTAVQTVTGTDPDAGTTLSYRIVPGADGANFVINSSTGVLTFVSAPDYEIPTDAGTNNVYDVTVEVSDGTLTATKAVTVTVTNVIDSPADYKADWLATNGLPDNSDWNSDPSNVGYSLATAYAFGLDPKVRSGAPITLVSSPTGSVKVVYLQRDIISGVTYAVKTGTDLAAGLNGNVIPTVSASQPSPAITGYTRYEATYTPSAPATKGFAKVQAIVP